MLTASVLAAGCSQSGGAASTTTSPSAPSSPATSAASEPGAEWEHVDATDVGLDPAVLEDVVTDAEAAGSSCVAVVRDRRMVVDEAWPEPEAPRQVFSVTKSLTSVLVGIAEHQGLLSVDDPVAEYVPEWVGTPSEEVTIEHILTGVSGRQWDMATDYLQMASRAEDKTAFAIGLEQAHPPGEVWTYNNAAVQVLSRVLEEATGVDAATFADRELFEPLDMADSVLERDPSGGPLTFMGLVSTCADLARLGQLMLQDGRWGDEQLLSPEYVGAATSPATDLNAAYGRLWWVNGQGPISGPRLATTGRPEQGADTPEGPLVPAAPRDTYWALGLDDQVLAVVPGEDLIAVRLGAKPPAQRPFGVEELTGGVLDAVVEPPGPGQSYGPGWSAVHSDSRNTDYATVTGPSQVELAWDRRLEGNVRIGDLEWTINLGPTSDPGGRLYVTSNVPGCHLQAIDVATGETVWCAPEVASQAVLSSPVLDADGRLFVADGAAMRAFDRDGTELWAEPIVGVPLSAQLSPAGHVVFVTHVGVVYLLDRDSGQPVAEPVELVPDPGWVPGGSLWPCARGTDGCPSANTPAVDPDTGRLYFSWWEPGAPQAGIRAMQIVEGSAPEIVDVWMNDALPGGTGASPVLSADGATLYVTDNVDSIHALDAATGELTWSYPIGIAAGGSLSVSPDGLILPPGGTLQAIRDDGDRATLVWRSDELQNRGIATQAAGDRVYATVVRAPGELDLVVVDASTGEVLDREPIEGTTRFSVGITLAADGSVLVPTIVGALVAFRPDV